MNARWSKTDQGHLTTQRANRGRGRVASIGAERGNASGLWRRNSRGALCPRLHLSRNGATVEQIPADPADQRADKAKGA